MRKAYLINAILSITVISILGLIYSKEYVGKMLARRYTKQRTGDETGFLSETIHNESCVSDQNRYSEVKFFILFIGYARSGSTLMGSILDAHPNAIISNEYAIDNKFSAFNGAQKTQRYIFDQLFKSAQTEATKGQRATSHAGLFNYNVPGQWQGKYDCFIKVMGDKRGVSTARSLVKQQSLYEELRAAIRVPIKFIHIYRNPFDNVATMLLRYNNQRHQAANSQYKAYKNNNGLQSKIRQYLKWVKNVESIRSKYPKDVLDIDYSQLLRKPTSVVRKLCTFLELNCSRDYIQSCKKKIFQKETKTRLKVFWPKKLKFSLAKGMEVLAPYRQFSFNS